MDVDWTIKYDFNGPRAEAIKTVIELEDPRIVPAKLEMEYVDFIILKVQHLHGYNTISDQWLDISLGILASWCSHLYEDLADIGIIASDMHCENIMLDPYSKHLQLIDYEQFLPYTEEDYEFYKEEMHKRIHLQGLKIWQKELSSTSTLISRLTS